MRLKMLESTRGSEDAYSVKLYEAGKEYDIADGLARDFLSRKVAVEVVETGLLSLRLFALADRDARMAADYQKESGTWGKLRASADAYRIAAEMVFADECRRGLKNASEGK